MSHLAKRSLALALGTILSLGALEGGLRVWSAFIRARNALPAPAAQGDKRRVILCEGDSVTWGEGGRSYPEQMEERLNREAGAPGFRVVNAGIPGNTSGRLSREFDGHLRRHAPELVIVMTGINDAWFDPEGAPARPGLLRASKIYQWVSAYRFGLGLKRDGENRLDARRLSARIRRSLERRDREGAVRQGQAAVRAFPDSAALHADLGRAYLESGRARRALEPLERAIALDLSHPAPRRLLSEAYLRMGERGAALDAARRGLADLPASADLRFHLARVELTARRPRAGSADILRRLERETSAASPPAGETAYDALARELLERDELAAALSWTARGLQAHPGSDVLKQRTADLHFRRKDYPAALAAVRSVAGERPGTARLAWLTEVKLLRAQGAPPASVEAVWRKAAAARPDDETPVRELLRFYTEQGRWSDVSELRSRLAGLPPGPQSDGDARDMTDERMERELRRMAATARRRGVKLVFSSFHETEYPAVPRVARALGIPYIDLRPAFARRFKSRAEYVSYDGGHCNTRGYGLMAEVLGEAVLHELGR